MRARHQALHLETQMRALDHEVTSLRRDLKDLSSRYAALTTEAAIKERLRERHIAMHDIATGSIISLEAAPPAALAANLDR